MLNYKGYIGMANLDDDAGIFHGEVINTRDVITFQGTCVEELKQAFKDSVDDYLDFCAVRGQKPEKPFSGRFPLRMSPETHQQAYLKARTAGISLNEWVNKAIEKQLT
jgi:predicted HicB family RNase H-like nuclease